MKIELDLPSWVDERHIRIKADEKGKLEILAGIELVAFKYAHHDYWHVKVGRCNGCGDCCIGVKKLIYPTIDGACIHLQPEDKTGKRLCAIALQRARTCDADPIVDKYERCSITYKKVKQA